MSDEQQKKGFYDRQLYVEKWGKILKCKGEIFAVAAELVNQNKNFQSAAALIFGLSWAEDKEWLQRCSQYWKDAWNKFPAGTKATPTWCYEFQQHYIKDVDKLPSGK
jgi:hypothetical protein